VEGTFLRLVWSDTHRSGNRLIDTQHEQLFRHSNLLLDALLSGRPFDEVLGFVTGLLAAVVQHFHDEEEVLATLGFPGLIGHANRHAALTDKALELEKAFRAESLSIGSLFQFLANDVVANHMLKADREFFHLTTT
jgi:hemerythrin-like metal-binding protein